MTPTPGQQNTNQLWSKLRSGLATAVDKSGNIAHQAHDELDEISNQELRAKLEQITLKKPWFQTTKRTLSTAKIVNEVFALASFILLLTVPPIGAAALIATGSISMAISGVSMGLDAYSSKKINDLIEEIQNDKSLDANDKILAFKICYRSLEINKSSYISNFFGILTGGFTALGGGFALAGSAIVSAVSLLGSAIIKFTDEKRVAMIEKARKELEHAQETIKSPNSTADEIAAAKITVRNAENGEAKLSIVKRLLVIPGIMDIIDGHREAMKIIRENPEMSFLAKSWTWFKSVSIPALSPLLTLTQVVAGVFTGSSVLGTAFTWVATAALTIAATAGEISSTVVNVAKGTLSFIKDLFSPLFSYTKKTHNENHKKADLPPPSVINPTADKFVFIVNNAFKKFSHKETDLTNDLEQTSTKIASAHPSDHNEADATDERSKIKLK